MKIHKYICDYCKDTLPRKHLSIHFGGWSGYVDRVDGEYKHIENAVRPDTDNPIKHFCNMQCLRQYFLKDKPAYADKIFKKMKILKLRVKLT